MWRRHGLAAGWAMVLAAWLVVVGALVVRVPTSGSDFAAYLGAAQALRFNPHANIYELPILTTAVQAHGGCTMWGLPYLYQPLLALLLEPLAALPCAGAWYIWQALNIALWAACAFALARSALPISRWLALGIAVLALSFLPLIQGLVIGEIHVIILAICLGAAGLVRRDRPYLAGALLGFGAVIKYFPAFLVLYYLLRGKWRVAAGAAVASIALGLAELLVVGPQTMLHSVFGLSYAVNVESRGAVAGSLVWAALAGIAFVVGVLWAGRSRAGNDHLGVAWTLATIVVISPLVQWPYITWLLPAYTCCLLATLDTREPLAGWRRWGPLALMAIAYILILTRMLIIQFPAAQRPLALGLTSGTAAVMLWVLCGIFYLRSAGATFLAQPLPTRQPRVVAPPEAAGTPG